jgi:F-type H+-transporting ATPase subunit epsilon
VSSFHLSLVCPTAFVFYGEAEQVDFPGAEGDMGVLAGHAPIVSALRPGIVKVMADGRYETFVVMGGIAEFSGEELTILADAADRVEDFDVAVLNENIEKREQEMSTMAIGEELDREIALLDQYKTLHRYLTITTAL